MGSCQRQASLKTIEQCNSRNYSTAIRPLPRLTGPTHRLPPDPDTPLPPVAAFSVAQPSRRRNFRHHRYAGDTSFVLRRVFRLDAISESKHPTRSDDAGDWERREELGRDGMAGAKPAAATGGKQDLEEALLQIVHQHRQQSLRQRQQTEKAKKDAMKSAVRVADLLVDTVDGGVQELYVNEKRIELEARALFGTIARYRRQTDQWLAATNEINSVLKEIGDFENWMKIMDFECKSINAAIRNIHQS